MTLLGIPRDRLEGRDVFVSAVRCMALVSDTVLVLLPFVFTSLNSDAEKTDLGVQGQLSAF
jgi:hypothetical protein